MKKFRWQGINKYGTKVRGETFSTNESALKIKLKKSGITLLKIYNIDNKFLKFKNKISTREIIELIRELSILINSGVSLVKAFDIMMQSRSNLASTLLIQSLQQQIAYGSSLTDSLKKHPNHFDELFCNLVYVGEQSGTLVTILNQIVTYKTKIAAIRQQLKKALFYPLLVSVIAILVTLLMLIFVIPQFAAIFANFNMQLPWFTQLIIIIASVLQRYGWLIGLLLVMGVFILNWSVKRNLSWRELRDLCILKIPVIGTIAKQAIWARCFYALAIVLQSGIALVEGLKITAKVSGNIVFTRSFLHVAQQLPLGLAFSSALEDSQLFSNRILQMIIIGEESGTLDLMLLKIAEHYSQEVDYFTAKLGQLMEPTIMIFLCLFIGGIIIAMYLPMFSLGTIF